MTDLEPTGVEPHRWRALVALASWLALLVATLLVVPNLAPGAGPPDVAGVTRWASSTDPALVVAAALRLVVMALAAYLMATTLAAIGAQAWATRRGVGAALPDRLVVPPIRRIVAVACGVSLSMGTLHAIDDRAHGRTGVAVVIPATSTTSTSTTTPRATTSTFAEPIPVVAPAVPEPAPAATVPATSEHVVEGGESFWAIAEAELRTAWRRTPVDEEIDPYWRDLIGANRDRLVAPGVPDLLFPGQSLRVPPCPQPPSARHS